MSEDGAIGRTTDSCGEVIVDAVTIVDPKPREIDIALEDLVCKISHTCLRLDSSIIACVEVRG
jgi:hypothetical protein